MFILENKMPGDCDWNMPLRSHAYPMTIWAQENVCLQVNETTSLKDRFLKGRFSLVKLRIHANIS